MTTYTEPMRNYEFLLSEGDGSISREVITIAAGEGALVAGTVLGKITSADTAAVATAFAGNTGTGAMGTITVTTALAGTYRLIIIEPATDAGSFIVEGPTGVLIGTGTVGSAFSAGGLAFTLADATDFKAGDGFTIVVAAGSGYYAAYDDANADGSEVACAILAQSVDSTNGAVTATGIVRLAEVKTDQLQWDGSVDGTAKTKAYADLKLVNIICR